MTIHLTRPRDRRPPTRPTRRSSCCAPSSPSRPIVFGLDKFANVLTDWPQYLAPWIDGIVPGTAQQAMYAVGVVEILAGVLVAVVPRIGAWVVAAWLAGIIVNLLTIPGFYDIALRDFGLLVAPSPSARLAVRYAPAAPHRRRRVTAPDRLGAAGPARPASASSAAGPPSTCPPRSRRSPTCSGRWAGTRPSRTWPTPRGGSPTPTPSCSPRRRST